MYEAEYCWASAGLLVNDGKKREREKEKCCKFVYLEPWGFYNRCMAEFFKVLVNTDDALTTDQESIVSHNLFESFVLQFFPIRPLFMVFSPPV